MSSMPGTPQRVYRTSDRQTRPTPSCMSSSRPNLGRSATHGVRTGGKRYERENIRTWLAAPRMPGKTCWQTNGRTDTGTYACTQRRFARCGPSQLIAHSDHTQRARFSHHTWGQLSSTTYRSSGINLTEERFHRGPPWLTPHRFFDAQASSPKAEGCPSSRSPSVRVAERECAPRLEVSSSLR